MRHYSLRRVVRWKRKHLWKCLLLYRLMELHLGCCSWIRTQRPILRLTPTSWILVLSINNIFDILTLSRSAECSSQLISDAWYGWRTSKLATSFTILLFSMLLSLTHKCSLTRAAKTGENRYRSNYSRNIVASLLSRNIEVCWITLRL
jgi:hypothetical protein